MKGSSERQLLIISQGSVTDKLVSLTVELAAILPDDFRIVYKLHPGEVLFTERYSSLYNLPNVKVVTKGDLYQYIADSACVLGVYSTALYEAAGLEKQIC